MKNFIYILVISLIVSFSLTVVVFNIPAKHLSLDNWFGERTLGIAALTDISSTDTVSDFPTVQNANNTTLETAINTIEGTTTNSTIVTLSGLTTANSLSSASALATIGTIVTGAWNGTPIPVLYNGTGTTSPTVYRTMIGDSIYGFTVASTTGTSGQFWTSGGVGAYPTWTTSAVSLSDDYAWTGNHNFLGTTLIKDLNASSTASNPLVLNGVSWDFPPVDAASSTVFATDGSGQLTLNTVAELGAISLLVASSAVETLTDSTTEADYGLGTLATLQGGLMGRSGALRVEVTITAYSDSSGNDAGIIRLNLGGTVACESIFPGAISGSVVGTTVFTFMNLDNEAKNHCIENTFLHTDAGIVASTHNTAYQSSAKAPLTLNTVVDQTISVGLDWASNGAGTETLTVSGVVIYLLPD